MARRPRHPSGPAQARRRPAHAGAFHQAIVASAPVAMIAMDSKGNLAWLNPAAENLLGYGAEELAGEAASILWPGEPLFPPVGAQRWIRKDGGEVRVRVEIAPLAWEGEAAGRLVVVTDGGALEAIESELRAREAEAQSASRAKSVFLATMSHEVRTPLIGILGMLELLSVGQMDPEQRRAVNVMHQSARNLLHILGGILDFTRIEAGHIDLAPEALDLRQMAEESAFEFSRAAASKGIDFTWSVDERLAAAHAVDGPRLKQILANLLSNAVKFTPEGSVDFRIAVDAEGGGVQRISFRVRDTGVGVAKDQHERLFQPFVQAEPATTRRYSGTGLGLAICRRIVEAMDGRLKLASALGQGTTATVTLALPLADPAAIPPRMRIPAPAVVSMPAPTVEEAAREGTLILLAEDHPTNRLVLQHQIRSAGYASEAASDGEQALGRWSTGRYGMVLTDVHMPGLDGYDLTAAIRDLEASLGRARTPIVAITANALEGEAERCLAAGMDDYLSKPVTIPELSSKLAQWLPRAPSMATAQPVDEEAAPVAMGILLDLADGDAEAAKAILGEFMESAGTDLDGAAGSAEARDAVGLARHAHRLKGSAAMIGAVALAKAASELEALARNRDWLRVEGSLSQVRSVTMDLGRFASGPG